MMHEVRFERDGLTLVGHLYTPAHFNEKNQYPAMIVQGSLTSVKEQMAATYAGKLAGNGFIVLACDYSHYGASEGQPRQFESPANKLADLNAAVAYLASLPYVKGIGMVGICTSAGNAAYLASANPQVKVLATVAGYLPEPALMRRLFGDAELAHRRDAGAAAHKKYEASGEQIFIPAYSVTDKTAANYNPAGNYDYYMNPARGGVPEWRNAFAVMSWQPWLDFDPIAKAPSITAPTLVVHSDGCAFPEEAKKFYAALRGEKALAWGDGTHFDYYDQLAQVDYAVDQVSRFFRTYLS